jgi:hypothetical protein
VLWPAFLVGLLVGSLAGNDTWGWVAAAVTAGSIYAIQRARGNNRTCSMPRSEITLRSSSDPTADEFRDSVTR